MCSCRLRLEEELASQWLTCSECQHGDLVTSFLPSGSSLTAEPRMARIFLSMTFQSHSALLWLHFPPHHTVDSHCSLNMCWLLPRPCLCSLCSVFWKALLLFFLSHSNPSFQVSDIMFPFPSNFLKSHTSQSNLSISSMYFSWDTAFFCFTCFYLFILYVYVHICAYVPWYACSSEDSSWELIFPFYHVGSGESGLAASAPTHWAILPVLFCWIPSHSTITYIQEQLSFCSLGTLSVSLRVPSCRVPFLAQMTIELTIIL